MMALGYFTLCFGGDTAKPYATIDGHRYEVQVTNYSDRPTSSKNEVRYLVDQGKRFQIRGNDDGSVSLLDPSGSGTVTRTIAKGGFESGGERSPLFVMVMLIALSLISIGNGFFKPNISTMVGALYAQGDRRRDAGFTIFYMGINMGSIGSQLLCPILADLFGWWAGFGLAAAGMLFSWSLIQYDGGRLAGYGEPPARTGPDRAILIYILALCAIPVFYILFTNLMNAPEPVPGAGIWGYIKSLPLMGKLLFGSFLIGVPAILIWSWFKGSRTEFQMMVVAMVLVTFNVVFWTLFEQAGSSLTLFADRNTELSVFGLFSLSAPQTQNFNPVSIVLFAPVMSILWTSLARTRVPANSALRGLGFVWSAVLVALTAFLAWRVFVTLTAAGHSIVAIV